MLLLKLRFLSLPNSGGTPRHSQLLDFLCPTRNRLTVMQSRHEDLRGVLPIHAR